MTARFLRGWSRRYSKNQENAERRSPGFCMRSSSTATRHLSALRFPKNAAGLRFSLHFSTAADITSSLLPPPAAGTRNSPCAGKALRAVEDASPYKNTERRDDPSVTRRAVTRRAISPLAQGRLYGPPRASAPTGYGKAGRFPPLSQPADTPVDSSPRGGAKWRALHFGKGAIAGDGRSFLVYIISISVYIFWFT